MSPQQKRSFLPYSRGINPEDLRLGSLHLNPLDPDDGLESKRFDYQENLNQEEYEEYIKTYIRKEQQDARGSKLDFQVSKDSSLALKFTDILRAEGSENSTVAATVEGKSGRRIKIRKPEAFLRDKVITQDGVREWIRTKASISRAGIRSKHAFKAPRIWMVTGVQLISGGDIQVGSSRYINGTIGASGDPALVFGAPPGTASIKAEVSHGHGSEANQGYSYDDERVWAAQFMEIKIEYGREADEVLKTKDNKPIPASISDFDLLDIADLKARGIRTAHKPRADVNGELLVKPTKPVGRIVFDGVDNSDSEDNTSADFNDIQIDDQQYVELLKDIDWERYDECVKYLQMANQEIRLLDQSQSDLDDDGRCLI